MSQARFFQTYGNMFSLDMADKHEAEAAAARQVDPRELPFVKEEALASIAEGGYAQAVARLAALLASHDEPIPLARLELKRDLKADYAELLPDLAPDAWRRVRGEQDIVVRYARERAMETLPGLLADRADRERFVQLVDSVAGLAARTRAERARRCGDGSGTQGAGW